MCVTVHIYDSMHAGGTSPPPPPSPLSAPPHLRHLLGHSRDAVIGEWVGAQEGRDGSPSAVHLGSRGEGGSLTSDMFYCCRGHGSTTPVTQTRANGTAEGGERIPLLFPYLASMLPPPPPPAWCSMSPSLPSMLVQAPPPSHQVLHIPQLAQHAGAGTWVMAGPRHETQPDGIRLILSNPEGGDQEGGAREWGYSQVDAR